MRPHLIRPHHCLRCYAATITGDRHSGIQRARQKRAWRKYEEGAG